MILAAPARLRGPGVGETMRVPRWRGWICALLLPLGIRAQAPSARGDRCRRPAPAGRPALRRRALRRGARGLSRVTDRRDPAALRRAAAGRRPLAAARRGVSRGPGDAQTFLPPSRRRAPDRGSRRCAVVLRHVRRGGGGLRARAASRPPSRVPATATPARCPRATSSPRRWTRPSSRSA